MAVLSPAKIFLYFYILQNAVFCDSSLATTAVTFQPLCSRMCHNVVKVTEDIPLFMCSCSSSCTTYGDCCYDYEYRNKTTWDKTDFICLSVFGRGRYKVVAGCPADQSSDFCKDAIGHLPPVTSKITGTTYANVFCANCNGDGESLATWNVGIKCAEDADSKTSTNDRFQIVYRKGHLWRSNESKEPKGICHYHAHFDNFTLIDSLELRTCDTAEKISDCSLSWTDSKTIDLCRSYEDPVFFGNRIYRNLHCAECNYKALRYAQCLPYIMELKLRTGSHDLSVVHFCSERGHEACIKYMSNSMGKGRPYRFSRIMNISQMECVPDSKKRCCEGEKYDPRSKRCRKIH